MKSRERANVKVSHIFKGGGSSISADGEELLPAAVGRNDPDLNRVSGVDVALSGRRKRIFGNLDGKVKGDGVAVGVDLVLPSNLGVQERLNERGGGTTRTIRFTLKRSYRVEAVDGANPVLIQARQEGECVVGEEAMSIEDRHGQLRNRLGAYFLGVLMLVHADFGAQILG